MKQQLECNDKDGFALIVVMGFVLVLTILVTAIIMSSGTSLRMSAQQAYLEYALYTAQAGAERAAAYVANGGAVPVSFSGTNGLGTYVVAIIPTADPETCPQTIGGQLSINPSASAQNEFTLRLPDGTIINRDTLSQDYGGYTGPAVFIHIKPKGNGNQNTLYVNNAPYDFKNQYTYDILSPVMSVCLYNDNVNPQGKAMGHWMIGISTTCASLIVSE